MLSTMLFNRDRMRELRSSRNMTMGEAAAAAGMNNRQQWYELEAGRRQPSLPTLERIAHALGVAPDELFATGTTTQSAIDEARRLVITDPNVILADPQALAAVLRALAEHTAKEVPSPVKPKPRTTRRS